MHFYAILVIFSVLKSVISAVEPHKFGRFYEIVIPEYGTVSGEVEKINIMYGESVYQLMNSLCGSLIKKDMCSLYADTISQHIYYWAWYTPSRNSSTVEDFSSARFDIINHIKSEYNAKKYLEMGCERGETFTRINQDMDIAYCIDPDIGGTHKMTSDNFFSNNNITFDLIFVDGMHEAHQVLRDVQNSLRWLKYDGHIVLHDCNPQREYEQRIPRPQLDYIWNGDVWKAAATLRLQDGLEVVIADVDYGVGIVRRKFNRHRLPPEWEARLVSEGVDSLQWSDLEAHRETLLRLMTMEQVRAWLDEKD